MMAEETPKRFWDKHRLKLDPTQIPAKYHALIPLAEKWGIGYVDDLDDYEIRRIVFTEASLEEIQEMVETVWPYMILSSEISLYEWLASEAATTPPISDEYLAYTFLGMAHDRGVKVLEGKIPKSQS